MYARTRDDARRRFPDPKTKIEFVPPAGRFPPTYDSIVTPACCALLRGGAVAQVRVDLPNCVFPDVNAHGRPSNVTVTMPQHPIMAGLPSQFAIAATEMYDEPFHVPEPDAVLFREDWREAAASGADCSGILGRAPCSTFARAMRRSPCSRTRT